MSDVKDPMKRVACQELTMLERVYADTPNRKPEVQVPARGDLRAGDEIVLHDLAGNEVDAVVKRVEFVVVPDMTTFRNPRVGGEQGELL